MYLRTLDRDHLRAVILTQQCSCNSGIRLPREKIHQVARWIGDDTVQRVALKHPSNLIRRSDDAGNIDIELFTEQPAHGVGDFVGTFRIS